MGRRHPVYNLQVVRRVGQARGSVDPFRRSRGRHVDRVDELCHGRQQDLDAHQRRPHPADAANVALVRSRRPPSRVAGDGLPSGHDLHRRVGNGDAALRGDVARRDFRKPRPQSGQQGLVRQVRPEAAGVQAGALLGARADCRLERHPIFDAALFGPARVAGQRPRGDVREAAAGLRRAGGEVVRLCVHLVRLRRRRRARPEEVGHVPARHRGPVPADAHGVRLLCRFEEGRLRTLGVDHVDVAASQGRALFQNDRPDDGHGAQPVRLQRRHLRRPPLPQSRAHGSREDGASRLAPRAVRQGKVRLADDQLQRHDQVGHSAGHHRERHGEALKGQARAARRQDAAAVPRRL
mmetsp:Transcript_17795/g.60096  ORF Transcript_17795/g.60096 Transcript_17795/m.60096 type:complete len:351 (-) Transcript_17795:829-1881(-)